MSPISRKRIPKALLIGCALLALAPAAQAEHPSRDQMEKVGYLAHELYQSARYLHDKSAAYATYDPREDEALYALEELARRADVFSRAVERHAYKPRRTERAFRALDRAFRHAADGFPYLEAYDHHERDFYELERLMSDLVAYYGYEVYERDERRHRNYHKIETALRIFYVLHHVLEDH